MGWNVFTSVILLFGTALTLGAPYRAQAGPLGCLRAALDQLFMDDDTARAVAAMKKLDLDLLKFPVPSASVALHRSAVVLRALNGEPVRTGSRRIPALTPLQANEVYRGLENHPVVSLSRSAHYEGQEKGFCFGRAMATHIELLYRGVEKTSIRKLWAVGNLDKKAWRYHVATAVRGTDGRWWTIDPSVGRIMSAEEWYQTMQSFSTDGRVQLIATQADRFHVNTALPFNYQDLKDPEAGGYFIDLLREFRTRGAFSGPKFERDSAQ